MKDLTMLFEGIVTVLILVITICEIPWIRAKISSGNMQNIIKWVKIAVQAAEQIYNQSGMGAAKKDYVITFLEKIGVTYDKDKIDAMIESAVLELKGEFSNDTN